MTKYKLLYIVLGIHILCGILGFIVICTVPETDHIRWNIGYIIGYIFVLSLIFSFFIHIPNKLPKGIKYGIRIYKSKLLFDEFYIKIRLSNTIRPQCVLAARAYCAGIWE